MNNSLYKKNFTITAVLLVLSFFILGVSVMMLGRGFALRKTQENIALAAQEVSYSAGAFLGSDELSSWNLRIIISTVARSTGNQIFLTDAGGYIVSTSESSESIGKRLADDVIQELQTNGSIQEMTTLGNYYNGRQFYVVALPVTGSFGNVAGYVFVGSDCTDILSSWGTVMKIFVLSTAGIMMLALVLTFYASKRQAEPLNEMAAAAKRFARGDFSARVLNDGRQDEIGALTESFNSMAESLEKSDQLRSDFIANVSHELKTPMTTIAGFADGILDGTIPREEQDRYLETISSETKRLNRLVRQMLDMSRMQSAEPAELLSKCFNLSEIIMRTLLTFETKITERGLDVDAQIPEESIIVRGDGDAYTQVIYNLLDNAVKFASPGSTLGISLWKQDGKAYVSVKNIGEEISPDELPFVFDRFRKTDRSRSRDRDGVGLGLSIVKTILSNHGENVFVTSQNGVTEFIFTAKLK